MITYSQHPRKLQRWPTLWSISILILSCLPYAIASLNSPAGWQFAGILVNPLDGHSYLAKMAQGQAGAWLFHLTYSPEPHDGAFIFTFYLVLGHIARLTQLSPILIFHAARLVAGFFLLHTITKFLAKISPNLAEQRLAFLFLSLTSGLGWLGVMFGAFPIDLWVPEAFVSYSLYANPHFPLAIALMLHLLGRVVWPAPMTTPRTLISTGLIALALALVLPFALITVGAILAAYLGWLYLQQRRLPWLEIWPTLFLGLFAGPVILYDYWISTTNSVFSGWGAQNITTAPALLDVALGYGLVGFLALVGSWLVIRGERNRSAAGGWISIIWLAITLILIYLPFELQRRLINGLHIPIAILAALGLERGIKPHVQQRAYHLLTLSVLTLGGLGTLFVWSLPLIGALQAPEEMPTTALLFLRDAEVSALAWLDANSDPDDVILAGSRLGMFIPGRTGARAFYGHPFETIEASQKKGMVEAFYQGQLERVSPPATFIIYGPDERAIGEPKNLSEQAIVYESGRVVIFKLLPFGENE